MALKHFLKKEEGVNVLYIDLPFSKLEKCYVINQEIEKVVSNYENVFIDGTETYASFDFEFLKDKLNLFGDIQTSKQKEKVLFYYRSDYFRKWGGARQAKHIVKLFSFLKQFFDDKVKFCVLGDLDNTKFPSWIIDERVNGFSALVDYKYNNLFNSSLICIGLTGSHMLFPSMFSECTVHIHPSHKYKNMAEDTISRFDCNEVLSSYAHLHYFGNHNCSDLSPLKLGTLVLLHYQAQAEKKYKVLIKQTISQKEWLNEEYSFLHHQKVNTFRERFLKNENKKSMIGYYIDKIIKG